MSANGSKFGRNVFVLDISYSMQGLKSQTLQLSATRIIEDIPDNSYVGVVMFYENAKMCHRVTQITDRAVRDQIIASVPSFLNGGTDIGKGILFGVDALKNEGICTEGAIIYLVTDGGDMTGRDYVSDVLPVLKSAKVFLTLLNKFKD